MLEILYQDPYVVAVNKPAGMLVHRSFLDKHETVFVMQTLRDQLGQHVFPLHRLDRPTSGVLLFALSADVARQMNDHQALWQKFYLAIVRGYVNNAITLDYPLIEELDAIADAKARTDKPAQEAQTSVWPLALHELPIAVGRYNSARYSLVLCQPHTGRKHQIRRHLKHLFHPIVGDTTHGDGKQNQLFRTHLASPRLMLHAACLRFTHPVTDQHIEILAPWREQAEFFAAWGWDRRIEPSALTSMLTQLPETTLMRHQAATVPSA